MGRRKTRRQRRLHSQTRQQVLQLLEVLAVVATVAVPVIMLLLAMVQARQHVQVVQCAANLRQIHLALLSYAEQNDGELPVPAFSWDPRGPGQPWAIQVDAVGEYSWANGTLWTCVAGGPEERSRLFNCPADGGQSLVSASYLSPGYSRNFSYTLNVFLRGPGAQPWQGQQRVSPVRLDQIVNPAQKILIAEERDPPDGCFRGYRPLADRHFNKGNQCFADGHVELIDPAPFTVLNPFDDASPTIMRYVRLKP